MNRDDLRKTATVLTRNEAGPYEDTIEFLSDPESNRKTSLYLDREVCADMAWPNTVTVTIEPGDKLNES